MFSIRFSIISASAALLAMLIAPPSHAAMATAISAGIFTNCAVTTAGGALCWGQNNFGQLGNGSLTDSPVPVGVTGLDTGVAQIATGGRHTCALLVNGTVRCWGWNAAGQLGNNSTANSSVPVTVLGLSGAVAISTAWAQSCAVLATGIVKCWGHNNSGQIGDGTLTSRITPVEVLGLNGAVGIAAGLSHTCALINNGKIKCWGYNGYGQLGNGATIDKTTWVEVLGINDANAIVTGAYHTCAKTNTGAAKCWGHNYYGQLGNGNSVTSTTPGIVSGLSTGVMQLTASHYNHSNCALLNDGSAKCWGDNSYGKLGSGDAVNKFIPTPVIGLAGPVNSITMGASSACARVKGGVQCWGNNTYGEHGAGNTATVPFPQNTVGLFGKVPTQLPTPLSPVTSPRPVYTWKAIPGATSYRLRINGVTTSYTAAAVNCPDEVGLCTFASGLLTAGVYGWQVQGFNEYGDGEWSALIQFIL